MMRKKLVAAFGVFLLSAMAFFASSANSKNRLSLLVTKDPVIQSKVLDLYRLEQLAKKDGAFRELLKMHSKSGWDLLPKKAIFSSIFEGMNAKKETETRRAKAAQSSVQFQAAAAAGLVPFRSPAPAFSRNLIVTRDFGTPIQTEPSICVNPQNPQNVVLSAIDYARPYNSFYMSFDGGEQWQGPIRQPLTENALFASDPVLACGRTKVYQVTMNLGAKHYLYQGVFPLDVEKSDIAVTFSKDGGLNWENPSVVATNRIEAHGLLLSDPATGKNIIIPVLVITFLDKPWISVGPNPANPSKDSLYVSYTEFKDFVAVLEPLPQLFYFVPVQFTSRIVVASSLNEGKTWKEVFATEEVPGLNLRKAYFAEARYAVVQGSQTKVANDGTPYLAFYYSGEDGLSRGKFQIIVAPNFVEERRGILAAEGLEVYGSPRSAFFRNLASNFPQLAVRSRKTGDEEVYIAFAARSKAKPADDGDIYFVKGVQKGKNLSFTKPKRLNGDEGNALQFFPAIATDPTGWVHVMWGDTREDPSGLRYNIYYTRSKDGGKHWGFSYRGIREPDTRVSDFPSNPDKAFPGGEFIGDYFSIAAFAQRDVYMVWTDSRLAEFGGFNQKIAFARARAIPSPAVFLNPTQGPMAEVVRVAASGFQPDMVICSRLEQIQCHGKTNERGEAEFTIRMPLLKDKSALELTVFDESGNTASGMFYPTFGVSSIEEKLKEVEADVDEALTIASSTSARTGLILYILLGGTAFVLAVGFAFLFRRRRRNT